MSFADESLLYLLWATLPLAFVLWLACRKQKKRLLAFNSRCFNKTMTRRPSTQRMALKAVIIVAASVLLILSLAGPRWGFEWREVKQNGLDIMIALDVSQSMMAEDLRPNRLQRAKREVLDLLTIAEGDRIGLLAFAGTAFVQCPLTMDYSAVRMFIDHLAPELIPVQGTALGEAVLLALERLKESSPDDARGRAVVLMSDGEDQGERVDAAIAMAKKQGVKIYTVGLGTAAGAPIPQRGGGFKKDGSGNLVLSKFRKNTLEQLASETGGKFVDSVAGDFDLEQIYFNGIRGLSGGEISEQSYRQRIWFERFQYFLIAAIIFLVLEALILRTSPQTTTVRERKRPWVKYFAAFIFLLPLASTKASADLREKAHKAFNERDYKKAQELFEQAEVDTPDEPTVSYNKGVSQYKAGNFKEAIRSFKKTMQSENTRLRDISEFNLGNAQVSDGQFEQGIATYEQILSRRADDKKVMENLAYARKLLEQKKQNERENKSQDQNQKKQENEDNQQQSNQAKNNDNQAKNNANQDSDPQSPDQQKDKQQASQDETGKSSEERQKQEMSANNNKEQNQQDSQASKAESSSEKAHESTGQESISRKEAERLLRSVEDKMAKYMVRPSGEELKKYRQDNVDKDW